MAKNFNFNATEFIPSINSATDTFARIDDDDDNIEENSDIYNGELVDELTLADSDENYFQYEEDLSLMTLTPDELLQKIFNLPLNDISKVLESVGWDVTKAIELIETSGSSPQINTAKHDTSVPNQKLQSKQVCRHYLAGSCFRKDCWFSHDLETVVCKYWLHGRCLNGTNCTFAHGTTIVEKVSNASHSRTTLTAKVVPKETTDLQDHFPNLSDYKAPSPKLDFFAPTTQFSEAVRKKNPVDQKNMKPVPTNFRGVSTTSFPTPKISYQTPTKWVATGDALESEYYKHRQEAIDVAIARNRLFQQATEAYRSGNKAAAKSLSLQAHALNENLHQLHESASERIFSSRNKLDSHSIDLHGLHPDEATRLMQKQLISLAKQYKEGTISIVTGSGHHSRGNKAKVLPAVREFLTRKGWRFKETGMKDGYGGLILVDLSSVL
ncbi:hypothetical protein HK098_006433 [Nowakowskiella sp. JEL0407]|nr:hypothetical protein HK098_006433 [Nowakowskiella sp. JEL0407]